MKKLYTFLFISLFLFTAGAQEQKGLIRGLVRDKISTESLPGASILLSDSTVKGTISDLNGEFRFENLAYGRYQLNISYIGYESQVISSIDVVPGKNTYILIDLEESSIELGEVAVVGENEKTKALNPLTSSSSQTFSVEETMRFAGARNDVARMASNFAGVSTGNDANNDIVIRGNSPNGLLFRLEGADIPNPNHFGRVGASGGPVSILNNNVLSNSDFFTSAFPANYGNALSGVFDLNMRSGNNESYSFLGQIGFNGIELGAEGPISKKAGSSFLAYYRYSTLALFSALGIDFGTGTAIPQYQDLSFKVDLPTKKAGQFSVFGVFGDSYIEFKNSENEDSSDDLYSQNLEDIRSGTRNANIGLNHRYLINNKTVWRTTLWWSAIETKNDVDTFDVDIREPFDFYDGVLSNSYFGLNTYITHKLSPKQMIQGGIEVINMRFNFNDSVYYAPLSRYNLVTQSEGSTLLYQPYLSYQLKINANWKINAGLHSTILDLNQSASLEPRLGIIYTLNEGHSFSAAYGLHSQSAPIHAYFSKTRLDDGTYIEPNRGLDFVKSHHFVLGYKHSFSPIMQFKTEVYYQAIYDAIIDYHPSSFSVLNSGSFFSLTPDTLVNTGSGRNYGVELTLEKYMNKGMYFLITASLYNALYTASDGIERDNAFNGNYIFNALGGKEFELFAKKPIESRKKIIYIILDSKVTFAGGNRYTPLDLEESQIQGKEVYDHENAFSKQFDPYFRFDLRAGVKILGKKTTQEFVFDVQNITNHQNPYSIRYDINTGEEIVTYQLGLFPVFQVRIYF